MSLLRLIASRRFGPLFIGQFLGALEDNLFKSAVGIVVTFRVAPAGISSAAIVALASGMIILPYLVFSATAGQLADKLDRRRLIQTIKLAEIAVMALAALALASADVALMLGSLFLLGLQATFFGPLKYAVLPQLLAPEELVGGNALVEGATFLAILLGTIAGSLLGTTAQGAVLLGVVATGFAAVGWLASLRLPAAPAPTPSLAIGRNLARETWTVVRAAARTRPVHLAILGISWFWAIGATYLSLFPAYAKDDLGADEHVVTLFLGLFTVGIAAGSLACARLARHRSALGHLPLAALLMSIPSVDLWLAGGIAHAADAAPLGVAGFLATAHGLRIAADLLVFAFAGGLFIVPLYTLMQVASDERERARTVAANNIVNALWIVVASGLTAGLLAAGLDLLAIFALIGATAVIVAIESCRLVPDQLVRTVLQALLGLAYRVEVRGLEHLEAAGERAVVVSNHVSLLDGILIAAYLPRRALFAVNVFTVSKWWARPFMWPIEAYKIDPLKPMSMKGLIKGVKAGRTCVIFPEGRLTRTGATMKVYAGPALIADKADAPIVPVRIEGAEFTPFSRMHGKLPIRRFPKITITFLPARRLQVPHAGRMIERRRAAAAALYEVMAEASYRAADRDTTLFAALLRARQVHGGGRVIAEDIGRQPMTLARLIAASRVLGRPLEALAPRGGTVGLLLPTSLGATVAFFALHATGRVPAMLNFSTGPENMAAACRAASVRAVVTSRQFVARAKLEDVVARLATPDTAVVYLEDLAAGISRWQKLRGALAARLLRRGRRTAAPKADDPAVVLFTSGSEGTPKGVVLTHRNLLSNMRQVAARIDFTPADLVLNVLPSFHAFGLTGGTLLPILSGIKTFLYPSPLHYRIVPELAYDIDATILFGTDTFLAGYGRMAHPYDFRSLRYVFAGAERVRAETRTLWAEKFGIRILEGYGATETALIVAVNTPMSYRAGTVGKLIPGLEHRLEPVDGVARGGRLVVRGPNVMAGYLRAEAPGALDTRAVPDGWYDTGDIVDIDPDGFVTILGRAKRFAKIAGEMVSLAAVEAAVADQWPDGQHAVVAVADARKGEALVLLTTARAIDRDALVAGFRARGLSDLMVPRAIVPVDTLPLLGSGKTDYAAVQRLAAAHAADSAA
jgi:acyl-[acyl-carrier-protein]-phospholipid O-acyltransferase/long-chain-fatty-acid--[acyl-carrier-protein] ligase